MSSPFAYGVSALDDALAENPTFNSERGLSARRTKLEVAFATALRAFLEDYRDSVANVEDVRDMIESVPRVVEVEGVAGKRKELR